MGETNKKLIALEYKITFLKVTNLPGGTDTPVKVCWRRNDKVMNTPDASVVERTAVFGEHSLKMIARLEFDSDSRVLLSKMTYL